MSEEARMMRTWMNIVIEAGLAKKVTTDVDIERLRLQLTMNRYKSNG